jgi:hypothetical protein
MKSKKVWYYEVYRTTDSQGIRQYTPVLTTDICEARLQQGFRMAKLEDLIDEVCAGFPALKGIVEVEEGFFLWEETEDDCDYRKLHTLQVAILAAELEI